MSNSQAPEQEVLTHIVGERDQIGHIVLNRPRALNSLNPTMVELIRDALNAWETDPLVEEVVITSAIPKAYCAGGDVRWIRDRVLEGEVTQAEQFFAEEYSLNAYMAQYPKPITALVRGLAMGGGVGISAHLNMVVSDTTWFSMPEMDIGMVTDVGMSYLFQQKAGLPLGLCLATTAWRITASQAHELGFVQHVIPDDRFEEATQDVLRAGAQALDAWAVTPPADTELAPLRAGIEDAFSHDTWAGITSALDKYPELRAIVEEKTAHACPDSLDATVELFHRNAQVSSVREALDNEYAYVRRVLRSPNFAEGVRAVLVDKTRDAQFVDHSILADAN